MTDQFDELARQIWQRKKTPLEQQWDKMVGEGNWEPRPEQPTFQIFDRETDELIPCHLCGSTDDWVAEGDEVKQVARVFVCDHGWIWVGRGAMRKVSTVSVSKVGRFKQTGGPGEE